MDALQYLKEKYETGGNAHCYQYPDLPISTSLEKVCNYMQEFSDQQNAELREEVERKRVSLVAMFAAEKTLKERVKELEGVCEYALKVIKAVIGPFGATKPIIERIEKALKK